MLNRILLAGAAACALGAAPIAALAGPISGYPAASTPLSGSETVIGTQSGSTVQITTQSIANIVTAATNSWTGVQTFPSPGASHGSIVLTPGPISGTPPNGSLWTTSTGVFAEINGATLSLAVGNAVTQFGSVISGDCAEWTASGVIQDVGTPCGSGAGGGGGSPSGANGTLQYNNGGSFGGMSGFTYNLSSQKITGPDGTVWNGTGISIPTGKNLNINGGVILSGSAPALYVAPCTTSTWIVGGDGLYCTHQVAPGGDLTGMGTIIFSSATTAFGDNAYGSENLHLCTSCSYVDALGFEAGHLMVSGQNDVAVGHAALANEQTGNLNTALGAAALIDQDGAVGNAAVGASAGGLVSTGSNNTLIGQGAGGTITAGNYNIVLGGKGTPMYGIATGHGNVWVGGQGTTLADQNDSNTRADGDGNILEQYLAANGFDEFYQPLEIPFFASSNGLNGGGFTLGSSTIVGTGASVACATSHVCDSISGEVTLTTGAGVSTDGLALSLSFISRTNKPACIVTSFKAASGTDISDNWSETTGGVAISSNANLASSTAYTLRYLCGGI